MLRLEFQLLSTSAFVSFHQPVHDILWHFAAMIEEHRGGIGKGEYATQVRSQNPNVRDRYFPSG